VESFSWSDPAFSVDPYAVLKGFGGRPMVYDDRLEGWIATRYSLLYHEYAGRSPVEGPSGRAAPARD